MIQRRSRHVQQEGAIFARVLTPGRRSGEFHIRGPREAAPALLEAANSLLPYSLSPQELGDPTDVQRDRKAAATIARFNQKIASSRRSLERGS